LPLGFFRPSTSVRHLSALRPIYIVRQSKVILCKTGADSCAAASVLRQGTAPQAAEQINPEGGGGFNPRIKPTESTRALVPEALGRKGLVSGHDFSRAANNVHLEGNLGKDAEKKSTPAMDATSALP